ncbi:MAG: chitobiase/beta-hexosaminidase C-terminal domain-containing protein, partial [Prevotella sp.]|nr:chitobiase/beta-hexosaminidase C-terminal domain-containing protein [Prevotella sp.]
MKKIFTLVFALIGLAGVANAATVDDLEPLKHSFVLVCDQLGERPGKGALFGANHFLDLKGGSVATNKGQVDLSVLDPAEDADGNPLPQYVTQDIVDKYGAIYGGPHYNWLRLKNQQDMIALKLTAKSKIIIFEQGNNKVGKEARIPRISTDEAQTNSLNPAPDENHPATKSGFKWEFTVDDDGTYYIGSYNGDMFVSFIIVEANEAPGTPMVVVGDQKFEDGLFFREVTCTPVPATEEGSDEQIPTIVTYTTDGSAPTAASDVYVEPIKCYKNQTVKFQAFLDLDGGIANDDFICDGADNEANVEFSFNAPTINADGAEVSIVSEYQNATNFYSLNDGEFVQGDGATLEESATVVAYTEIKNGEYTTFTTNKATKDVYVLNPIKEKKVIAVTAGTVVVDEEATAAATDGNTVYTVEGGEISADKKDFFVKNLTFKVMQDAQYQVPEGQEIYIQMSNTNITFQVAEGDSVDVKVITAKNSCKTLNAENDESVTTDRKNYVNVSGTNYGHDDVTVEGGNIIEFGLSAGTYTFQKYSGTGNIMISSIEITPVGAEPQTKEGDVNGDNAVDVSDISSILTVMSGDVTKFSVQQADVNKDGKADVADISATLTIMAGGKVGDEEAATSRATRADNEVTVFTAEDVKTAEDGSFDLVVKMDFETTQTLVGWNLNV